MAQWVNPLSSWNMFVAYWGTVENEFSVIHNKIAIKQTEIHDDRDHNNNTVITKIVTSLMLSGSCHKSNKAFSRSISVVT